MPFWFSLFSNDVWGRKDPLCVKPQHLKAKLDQGATGLCVCLTGRGRRLSTQCKNCLDLCLSKIPCSKPITVAKFVDGLLVISKTEQVNDEIYFVPSCLICVLSFACTWQNYTAFKRLLDVNFFKSLKMRESPTTHRARNVPSLNLDAFNLFRDQW